MPDDPQTLDLIAQLLSRSRRWELIGAAAIIGFVFTAGGATMAFRYRFDELTANQTAITKALSDRVLKGDAYAESARLADTNQDKAIASLTEAGIHNADTIRDILERMAHTDQENQDRDKLLAEVATTQNIIVKLLDRIRLADPEKGNIQ